MHRAARLVRVEGQGEFAICDCIVQFAVCGLQFAVEGLLDRIYRIHRICLNLVNHVNPV